MICVTNLGKNSEIFFLRKKKLELKDLNSNMFLFLKKEKKEKKKQLSQTTLYWQNPFLKFILNHGIADHFQHRNLG